MYVYSVVCILDLLFIYVLLLCIIYLFYVFMYQLYVTFTGLKNKFFVCLFVFFPRYHICMADVAQRVEQVD